jgi:acetoin utilization protein AcuC
MSPASVAFIHSPAIEGYSYPPDCPFKTERAGNTRRMLLSMGLLGGPDRMESAPVPASRDELETFHTARYLDVMGRAEKGDLDAEGLFMGLGTEDCPVFRGMYEYAALACGASLTGARLLVGAEAGVAFNPSGGFHHAHPEKAGGFCYMNDVVIAALFLAAEGRRVLVLDVDVHHGDGTQAAFYDRDDVMTISLHESGETLFPWGGGVDEVGEGAGHGYNVNVPLPKGTYDEQYLRAFRQIAPPLIGAFDPDVIMLEIGMDCLSGDPMAHLSLTNNAYADVVARVVAVGKPVLAVGGGGYNAANTARGWALAWAVMCGEDADGGMDHALGGVMLETTDWQAGLRDRQTVPTAEQMQEVPPVVDGVIERVKATVFPLHGL